MTTKYYNNGVFDYYSFAVELEGTGLASGYVGSPTSDHINLTSDGTGELLNFESAHYSTLESLRTDYPLGTYSLLVNYDGSSPPAQTTYSHGLTYNVTEVAASLQITDPADGATDVSPTPTFHWTDCSGFADVLWMGIWDQLANTDIYDEVNFDPTTVQWSPTLDANSAYDLWVGAGWGDLNFSNETSLATWSGGDDSYVYRAIFGVEDDVRFSTIPEPATMSLLALGCLAMLRRRRNA